MIFGTHPPRRMTQRVGRRHVRERGLGQLAERAARRRQNHPTDLAGVTPVQALVDRVVLAVHGQHGHAPPRGGGHHQRASHDENFLVRERDGLPRVDGGEHGVESRRARRGEEHDVDVRMGRDRDQAVDARAQARGRAAAVSFQGRARIVERRRRRHRRARRSVSPHLRGELLDVSASGKRYDAKAIGVRVHDRQRTLPDRPRGSEDRDRLH